MYRLISNLFKHNRTGVDQDRMQPNRVVKAFQVFKDRLSRLASGVKALARNALVLEGDNKRLHCRMMTLTRF